MPAQLFQIGKLELRIDQGEMLPDNAGHLEGSRRHYLDGSAVHAGTTLELLLANGTWMRGRYEWSFKEKDPPSFHWAVAVEGRPKDGPDRDGDHMEWFDPEASMWLPSWATLRWPER